MGKLTAVARDQAEPYGAVGRSEWMDVEWQEHLRWVRVQDRWMNIVDIGPTDSAAAGPEEPIMFIHGLSGCWQNWLEQIPHFARDRRVIAVDLPGFGQSEMPAEEISISGYADAIDALMSELDVETAQIVGNSMGGFIGAELAIQYPERVERLVLVAAAGLSIESIRTERTTGLRHRAENIVFFTLGNIASRSHQVALRPRLRAALLMLVAAHPAKLPGPLAAQQVLGSGKPGFSDALEAMCRYPLRDRLEKIACPTLIVWGEKDLLVPVKDADIFEKLIPDARKIIYEDTGHVSMMERPERFNSDVKAFLDEAPGEQQPSAQAEQHSGAVAS